MTVIQVEYPTIDPSSFEPQNRQDGISGLLYAHNEGEFLAQVIETWINALDELIIIFNGCTDNSPQIIEEYEKKYYPKIRAFNYLPHVYSPNTKEQLELDTNNIHSFCFYCNFGLSQTKYKICVEINGDHVGIPEHLSKTYNFLKEHPLENTALFISGVNLWKNLDDVRYYVNLKEVANGDGDLAYWTVSPQHIFVKHPRNPLLNILRHDDLERYYLGFIFWHTRFLKQDYGLGNYGQYSEGVISFLEKKSNNAKLALLSPEFKQKHKDFQNVKLPRFPLYFDFGSLPDVKGVDSSTEILQQAVQHYQANRLLKAEQAYHQVLEISPDNSEAFYGLGVISQKIGNIQASENFLNKASQFNPYSVKIWFALGNLQQLQGKLTKATDAYRQALKLYPNSATIYNNLGYTLQQQSQLDEAIACYQKALELKPEFTEADVSLGNVLNLQGKLLPEQQAHYAKLNYQLGEQRRKMGDWQTAIAYYRQAIALHPDLVDADNHVDESELEEAIACYQKFLDGKLLHA